MTFEENPFRVLQVSLYATKATIIERADDLSFADPDREKIFAQARDTLLNPRKRVAAEVRWFVGCSQSKELKYVAYCLSKRTPDDEAIYDDDDYSSLSELNFTIYAADNGNYFSEWVISNIEDFYSSLDAEDIREQINAARKKSKFPAVKDAAAIRDELKNLRYEIRERLNKHLKDLPHVNQLKLATDLIEIFVDCEEDFGVIVEDFFDSYRLEMNPFFDETREKILSLLPKIKINADKKFLDELAAQVTAFVGARRPLDKFSIALGTNDFKATEKIFREVRATAIALFNEKDLVDEPLIIMRLLEQNFSYLPQIVEVIRKDINFLERTKADRPTKSFAVAMEKFSSIISSMERGLHLEKGFAQANLDFYLHSFRTNCETVIRQEIFRRDMKSEEWRLLNISAALIYLHMGDAMTWTNFHPKTTLELFRKAMFYAEASGDAELISLARKRVDKWREINDNIYRNSSGCLSVIAVAVVVVCVLVL